MHGRHLREVPSWRLPTGSDYSHDPAFKGPPEISRRTTLPIREGHAEGHFRRRRYTLKMLLSGHLVGKEFILTDQKRSPARLFLFREGKTWRERGRFCHELRSQLVTRICGVATPPLRCD